MSFLRQGTTWNIWIANNLSKYSNHSEFSNTHLDRIAVVVVLCGGLAGCSIITFRSNCRTICFISGRLFALVRRFLLVMFSWYAECYIVSLKKRCDNILWRAYKSRIYGFVVCLHLSLRSLFAAVDPVLHIWRWDLRTSRSHREILDSFSGMLEGMKTRKGGYHIKMFMFLYNAPVSWNFIALLRNLLPDMSKSCYMNRNDLTIV